MSLRVHAFGKTYLGNTLSKDFWMNFLIFCPLYWILFYAKPCICTRIEVWSSARLWPKVCPKTVKNFKHSNYMHVLRLVIQLTFWNRSSIIVFRQFSVSIGNAIILPVNRTMVPGVILFRIDMNCFRISLKSKKITVSHRAVLYNIIYTHIIWQ